MSYVFVLRDVCLDFPANRTVQLANALLEHGRVLVPDEKLDSLHDHGSEFVHLPSLLEIMSNVRGRPVAVAHAVDHQRQGLLFEVVEL